MWKKPLMYLWKFVSQSTKVNVKINTSTKANGVNSNDSHHSNYSLNILYLTLEIHNYLSTNLNTMKQLDKKREKLDLIRPQDLTFRDCQCSTAFNIVFNFRNS